MAAGVGSVAVDLGHVDEEASVNVVAGVECRREVVETAGGQVTVSVIGEQGRPAIVAYGDVGLHMGLSFIQFLNFEPVRRLVFPFFCFYGIDAPGQEAGATELGVEAEYATFEQLVGGVGEVMDAMGVERGLLMGLGAGATVLTHFMHAHPERVKGAVVIGATHKAPGWLEWAYSTFSQYWLSFMGVDAYVKDHLVQRYFTWRNEADAVGMMSEAYSDALDAVHSTNLWKFIASFMARPPLADDDIAAIAVPVLFLVGRDSYYYDDVIDFFGAFNPTFATLITKWAAGNMIHMEKPSELVEPLRLFFYRCGYAKFGLRQ